jgi:hypothetical protein
MNHCSFYGTISRLLSPHEGLARQALLALANRFTRNAQAAAEFKAAGSHSF